MTDPTANRLESDKPPMPSPSVTGARNPDVIQSEVLFGDKKLIRIRHSGEEYRLIITRNDKLVLQK